MPNEHHVKTALARKLRYILWFICAVLFVGMVLALAIAGARMQDVGCELSIPKRQATRADFVGSGTPRECISLERVTDAHSRTIGLSKYDLLPPTHGMLFDFVQPQEACMWMKDMKFSIDMIWLDETKKVLKIEKRVSPDTYPQSFCSSQPARYVIELAAGVSDQVPLFAGKQLNL